MLVASPLNGLIDVIEKHGQTLDKMLRICYAIYVSAGLPYLKGGKNVKL